MKPVDEVLRQRIDNLRKTQGNNAEPVWRLDIYRDREKMLGVIQGARITSGIDQDISPAVAHRKDGTYQVVFSRGGTIYRMASSPDNNPLTWDNPSSLFAGEYPDIAYDGSFTTDGEFVTSNLMMVYENPIGTINFRRFDPAINGWTAPVFVANGVMASIVRAWADPPEVGTQDQGLQVVFTAGGQLYYTHSDDGGSTWAARTALDMPAGGTKRNPQIFRLADYTLGIIYEYDNGINAEVWFLKTTRKYVNIASPDETLMIGMGSYRHFEFVRMELTMADETLSPALRNYRQASFDRFAASADDETVTVGAGEFRQAEFTGTNP